MKKQVRGCSRTDICKMQLYSSYGKYPWNSLLYKSMNYLLYLEVLCSLAQKCYSYCINPLTLILLGTQGLTSVETTLHSHSFDFTSDTPFSSEDPVLPINKQHPNLLSGKKKIYSFHILFKHFSFKSSFNTYCNHSPIVYLPQGHPIKHASIHSFLPLL